MADNPVTCVLDRLDADDVSAVESIFRVPRRLKPLLQEGLDVLLRGLSMTHDDEQLLALTGPLFDALYEYKRRALLTGREPA